MKKQKNRKIWPLFIVAIIFFFGIALILYPFIGNIVTMVTASTQIKQYTHEVESLTYDDTEDMIKNAEKFNESLYKGNTDLYDDRCLNINNDIICYIDIPTIKLYLPIYYGTSTDVLKKGGGYLKGTSLPVGGINTHSVIVGHTGLPTAKIFTEIDELKIGDIFYIHVLKKILAYQVDQIKIVLPDDDSDIQIIKGKDLVTLFTCTPYGINDHRLLVRGSRIDYTNDNNYDISLTTPTTVQEDSYNEIYKQIIIIAVIILISIIIFAIALHFALC